MDGDEIKIFLLLTERALGDLIKRADKSRLRLTQLAKVSVQCLNSVEELMYQSHTLTFLLQTSRLNA